LANARRWSQRLEFKEATVICHQWAFAVALAATQPERARSVHKLLASPTAERNAQSVRDLAAALEADKDRLAATAAVVQKVPPYRDPVAEKTRQLTEQVLDAQARELALDVRDLRGGKDGRPDADRERARRSQRVAELRQTLNRQLNEFAKREKQLFGQS
jgi:DNA repair exonuclease SbcCD ATPase subunit